jgi:murein DD-endopeptidase MepM/ murein hydrolase activator NlpD
MLRHGWPYTDSRVYRLCELYADGWHIKLLYMVPRVPCGTHVEAGAAIGVMQDVSLRYPPRNGCEPMECHLHFELWRDAQEVSPPQLSDVASFVVDGRRFYDPQPFLPFAPA